MSSFKVFYQVETAEKLLTVSKIDLFILNLNHKQLYKSCKFITYKECEPWKTFSKFYNYFNFNYLYLKYFIILIYCHY